MFRHTIRFLGDTCACPIQERVLYDETNSQGQRDWLRQSVEAFSSALIVPESPLATRETNVRVEGRNLVASLANPPILAQCPFTRSIRTTSYDYRKLFIEFPSRVPLPCFWREDRCLV